MPLPQKKGQTMKVQTLWKAFLLVSLWTFAAISGAHAAPVFSNSIEMKFSRIPAGTFAMGRGASDAVPAHTVTISTPFYLGKYEVTQAQWREVVGSAPSQFTDDNRPVENVSWNDVQLFLHALNEREGTSKYRLPTEAEWEYAASLGSQGAYQFGESSAEVGFYVWYNFNSGGASQPVGIKKGNALGLHDMQGNISEWVHDFYETAYYSHSPSLNPPGPDTGQERVARGCSWNHDVSLSGFTNRFHFDPDERSAFIGFRVLREVD